MSFFRKYDLILQTANERWSLSKKYMEILYFLQMFWKDGLSKKIILEYDLSCIIWKHGFLLPESMIFFIWTQNERRSFSRNTWKYKCYKYDIIPLPKNSKTIFPQEYTLKDWDSRLIFWKEFQWFSVLLIDLHKRFHVLLSSEKKKKLNI